MSSPERASQGVNYGGIPLDLNPPIRMRFSGAMSTIGYATAPTQTPTNTMALPTKKRGETTSLANHAVITIVATGYNK